MSVSGVRLYLELSLAVTMALGVLWSAWTLLRAREARARRWVRLGYALLLGALAAPFGARVMAGFSPDAGAPVQVWSGGAAGAAQIAVALEGGVVDGARGAARWTASLERRLVDLLLALLLAASAAGLARLTANWLRLRRHCRSLPTLRRLGRLRLSASDRDAVPFSAWTGGRAYVVLPVALLGVPSRLRLTIRHELQHLRARDAASVYLVELLRALLPWHPAAWAWATFMARLQEYACDQTLLARGVPLDAYADCLIQAAETSPGHRPPADLALGLGTGNGRELKRRIEMHLNDTRRRSPFVAPLVAFCGLALIGAAAVGAHGAVADRRVSASQANAISTRLAKRSGFTVPVDKPLLEQLNKMVGAEDQRAYWRDALARGEKLRPEIEGILERHALPATLSAVALVESGFSTLAPDPTSAQRRGAGVWQFIPETARHSGLRVDDDVDERMDLGREADAAARYLEQLHAEFDDWPLAIAAYTHGSGKVRQVIKDSGTRDAAKLVETGALQPYSSQVLAAMLLMEEPELLR
jgi:hypothetical protein